VLLIKSVCILGEKLCAGEMVKIKGATKLHTGVESVIGSTTLL